TEDKTVPGGINVEANLMAHAVVGAVVAQASGHSALAGAAGATAGEFIAQQLYPGTDRNQLTEEQKQTVSTLGTLAAGLAGGLTGGSAADTVTGAQAGKNAVENNSLSGDKARESVKQTAGQMKDQVRDTLGNGTLSAIVNSVIGAAADSGDAMLGAADYGADAAMALTACAVGDGYCGTALNDLSGKNQAVADSLKALMKSETWSAVAGTVKEAAQGNQAALEATGGMLAGIMLPGKKMPGNNVIAVENGTKAIIDSKKFDYLFGNVTSGSHNAERSTQLAQTMDRLGLETNAKGAGILTEHFKEVVNTKGNVIDTYTKGNQSFEVRESLLFGPSGKATKLETSFEIMPDGSRRFITTIPKEGKK
ncbi:VENN motif pre-toxin domain-containing protein, partial [Erwinia amylovora]